MIPGSNKVKATLGKRGAVERDDSTGMQHLELGDLPPVAYASAGVSLLAMRASSQLAYGCCCVVGFWLVWRRLSELRLSATRITYTSLEVSSVSRGHRSEAELPASRLFRSMLDGTAGTVPSKAIVIGKLSTEDTSWTEELGPEWQPYIYTVNDTSAPLHTARNKGREANAYLTYITEHYYSLSEVSVFVHAHRKGYPQAWHTEGIGNDIVDSLRRLNSAYVLSEGYANLRCNHDPGCSAQGRIQPYRHVNDVRPLDRDAAAEVAWLQAWPQLFPGVDVPAEIASACCAQFAVSRDQIRRRSLEEYWRYHEWLMETEMSDDISGRVMEYAWHIIFGKDVVHCPDHGVCASQLYRTVA